MLQFELGLVQNYKNLPDYQDVCLLERKMKEYQEKLEKMTNDDEQEKEETENTYLKSLEVANFHLKERNIHQEFPHRPKEANSRSSLFYLTTSFK